MKFGESSRKKKEDDPRTRKETKKARKGKRDSRNPHVGKEGEVDEMKRKGAALRGNDQQIVRGKKEKHFTY